MADLNLTFSAERSLPYPLFHPRCPRPRPPSLTAGEFESEFGADAGRESDYVEFKEGLSTERIGQAVVAFSNADGGVVLIGVRDDGSVKGLGLNGQRKARLHEIVANLHDPGRYDVQELDVDGRTVVVLSVHRREKGVAQTSDGRVLARRGASNRPLVGRALSDLVAVRSLRSFERTESEVSLSEADPGLLNGLARAWGWSGERLEDRLQEQGFLAGDGRLTVAGALYLTAEPRRCLGKAFVEVFRYRDEGDVYDFREEVAGPLPAQVERTTEIVMREIGFDLVVLGLHRHELPRLPEKVVREAIANAVAHRSYQTTGVSTRVEIWPNRVVVASPGGLPEPVTIENIREQNAARNQAVIATLRRFRLAEDAGLGVDVMEDEMAANLLRPPEFAELGDGRAVAVTLWLAATVTRQERVWIHELEQQGELGPKDRLLLVVAKRGEQLTNARAREILGVDALAARGVLQRLRDAGLLVQEGERGGAAYRISSDLDRRHAHLGAQEVDDLVLAIAEETPVTNALLRERTGLSRPQALAVLARLVASGRLERRGERRGTRYVRAGVE